MLELWNLSWLKLNCSICLIFGVITGSISVLPKSVNLTLKLLLKLYCFLHLCNSGFLFYNIVSYITTHNFFSDTTVSIFIVGTFTLNSIVMNITVHAFQYRFHQYADLIQVIMLDSYQNFKRPTALAIATVLVVGFIILMLVVSIAYELDPNGQIAQGWKDMFEILPSHPVLHVLQMECLLQSQISVAYQTMLVATVFYQARQASEELNEHIGDTESSQVLVDYQLYLYQHRQLQKAFECLNKYFTIFYAAFFLNAGVGFTVSFLIFITMPGEGISATMRNVVLFACLVLYFNLTLYNPMQVNRRHNQTLAILLDKYQEKSLEQSTKLSNLVRTVGNELTIAMMASNMKESPIKVGNVLNLTPETLLTFYSMITTYVVILVQFKLNDGAIVAEISHTNSSNF